MNGQYGRYGFMPQGGGFYNPFMQSPDIGGGINAITAMIAQRQAQEQQMQQQEWQRGITEERLGLERMQQERLSRPEPIAPLIPLPQAVQDFAVKTLKYKPEEIATLPNKERAGIMGEYEMSRRPKTARVTTPQVPLNVKSFSSFIKQGVTSFQSQIDDLEKPPTTAEAIMSTFGGGKDVLGEKQVFRDNMMMAQSELLRIQAHMAETNTMPSPEDIALANTLIQSIGRAEKEKGFWKTKKPTLTDRGTVMFEGKEYKLNPDGTVTIEGKTYTIKRK